jgi:hypothetical protein
LQVAAALAGCDALPSTQVGVTLQIYSGRPDPIWTLRDSTSARVVGEVAALWPLMGGEPSASGLPDETFVAYGGRVESSGIGEPGFRNDPAPR